MLFRSVEFADFQCPYSKEESATVRRMLAQYGDRVRLVYRDLPIASLHPDAAQAAMAARCAGEQGKYWAYHDKLFANSPQLDFASLVRFAKESGLDAVSFQTCLASNRYKAEVDADAALAARVGVEGTPTFFFNGIKVEGAVPEEVFERAIKAMSY